jgi:hypothetical protein
MLSNIPISKSTPYADEIIRDHQCGFQCYRSTTNYIFCICQILEKMLEYNETVHQLFVDFEKVYSEEGSSIHYSH